MLDIPVKSSMRYISLLCVKRKIMKITGYKKCDTELEGLMELSDVAISTSSKTLREIASFLIQAADEIDEIDELGEDYDHVHLMDEWNNWKEGYPDIQILSPKYCK